jgi:hypothetical protein
MDVLAHILLSLFSLSASAEAQALTVGAQPSHAVPQPALQLAPITVILSNLVAQIAPADVSRRFAQAIPPRMASAGNQAAGEIDFAAAAALADQAEIMIRRSRSVDETKLALIAQTLDDIAALAAAIRPGACIGAEITVKSRCFFDFVAELSMPAQAGHIVLTGHIPPGQGHAQVRQFTEPHDLDRIHIAYSETSVPPRLTVQNLRCRVPPAPAELGKEDWPLPIGAELEVYKRNSLDLVMKIRTEMEPGFGVVLGERVRLTLPPEAQFLITSIVNPARKPLLTCIKAI